MGLRFSVFSFDRLKHQFLFEGLKTSNSGFLYCIVVVLTNKNKSKNNQTGFKPNGIQSYEHFTDLDNSGQNGHKNNHLTQLLYMYIVLYRAKNETLEIKIKCAKSCKIFSASVKK